jgi:hypothetical protein
MVEAERDPTSAGCKFKYTITCQLKHVQTSWFVRERELNSRLNLNDPFTNKNGSNTVIYTKKLPQEKKKLNTVRSNEVRSSSKRNITYDFNVATQWVSYDC